MKSQPLQSSVFAFCLAMSCLSIPALAAPVDLDQLISSTLADIQAAQGYPKDAGVAVAVIRDGKVVFAQGYGLRDRSKGLPVTPSTLFAIGSNSKAFTATAIAMIQEEGKISVDQPVQKYAPDFDLIDPAIGRQITLVDMLSHRSGLPRHDLLWYATPFSRAELHSKVPFLPMDPRPSMGFRKTFQYNNLLVMSAGLLVERLSGKSWERFVAERLFAPLGMSHSGFSIQEASRAADFAVPYLAERELPPHELDAIGPAGSINSNLEDMSKWVLFQLAQGKALDGARLLEKESLDSLYAPRIPVGGNLGRLLKTQYGMGWFVSELEGRPLIWHGGNIDGYSAHVSFMPQDGIGLVILTNLDSATYLEFPLHVPSAPEIKFLPWQILHALVSSAAPSAPESALSAARFDSRTLSAGLLSEVGFKSRQAFDERAFSLKSYLEEDPYDPLAYAGTFTHPGYGDLKITQQGGALVLSYYGLSGPLVEKATDLYTFEAEVAGTRETFVAMFKRDQRGVTGVGISFEPATPLIEFGKR